MSIEVKNLSFSYGDRPVLHDISFSVKKGEFLSILGPNGVGKSTLFRCVLGLLSGYTGQVLVDGVDARNFGIRESAKHIAYIPQSSRSVFNYSVFDIVLMGRTCGLHTFRSPGKKDQQICLRAMEKVGISHLRDCCFHRLSGGEQQLVLIARALAQKAPILMLDEPTAMLDPKGRREVIETIGRLNKEKRITVVLITHHMDEAAKADRVVVLHKGEVHLDGTPRQVFSQVEKLHDIGLAAPETVELCNALNQQGFHAPLDQLEPEECARALYEMMKS